MTVQSLPQLSPGASLASRRLDRIADSSVVAWGPAAVMLSLTAVEAVREGGFWLPDARVVAVCSLAVTALAAATRRIDRAGALLLGSGGLFAAWWLLRATAAGVPDNFLPLGASVLGLLAAFLAVRNLTPSQRMTAAAGVAVIGSAISLLGFVGLVWRWYPLAMPAQGLWRLSSSITYSDAAGAILGVCLLVALSGCLRPAWAGRIAVCLCLAGVIAAQSRGAMIATAVGCALVPAAQYRRHAMALAFGAALGVVAVVTSPDAGAVPLLGGCLVMALFCAAVVSSRAVASAGGAAGRNRVVGLTAPMLRACRRRRSLLLAAGVVVVAVIVVVVARHEIGLRALAPSDSDRSYEWGAAWHQFLSAPAAGVGPDALLHFQAPDGTYAHFTHNEYLQVAADAGAIGLAAMLAAFVSVFRVVRRHDVLSSCAAAALVAWAVAGAFDFDWHLPVFGMLGGCAIGLASIRRNHAAQHA